ncbi:MAG: hypothetical protein Q8P32_01135 [Candidatus Komeilibacteria bacterium]|nr:hypothetical protein [Candidatus Komeilibacteria bacterium]
MIEQAERREFLRRFGTGMAGLVLMAMAGPVAAAFAPRAERRREGERIQMTLEAALNHYYRRRWAPWHDDVGVGIWSMPGFGNGQLIIWVDGRMPEGAGVDIRTIMVGQNNWVITPPLRGNQKNNPDLRRALQDPRFADLAFGPGLQDYDFPA